MRIGTGKLVSIWIRLASPATALACAACATLPADPLSPAGRLEGTDGAMHAVAPSDSNRFTVVVFFMAGCRHLEVHDARLRHLAGQYRSRGVGFFAVDSEMHSSMDVDRAEVIRHGYPFPILRDVGGRVARALRAHHAGYAIVLDGHGSVRYRGAIDSDRFRLHDDARPYLANALNDLLAGIEPRQSESESFGCALDL